MPAAIIAITSRSRAVSEESRSGATCTGSGRRLNSAITRRVTLGLSSASPSATTFTARQSSSRLTVLERKPLAPALSASKMYASISKVVSTMIRTFAVAGSVVSRWVTARPSRCGMRMSSRATSGRV